MIIYILYKMKSWRGIYFGDLRKSAKFNFANYFLMPNVHIAKHKMKYSYGTFEIRMPEEERDRPSRRNYYKYWVYHTQLSTSKLFIISLA